MKKEIGRRLREVREKFGLSQLEFGKLVGLSFQHVSRYERGIITPSSEILIKLQSRFHVCIDWLLTGKGSMFVGIGGAITVEEDLITREAIKKWIDEFWGTARPEEKIWFRIEFHRQFHELLSAGQTTGKNK